MVELSDAESRIGFSVDLDGRDGYVTLLTRYVKNTP